MPAQSHRRTLRGHPLFSEHLKGINARFAAKQFNLSSRSVFLSPVTGKNAGKNAGKHAGVYLVQNKNTSMTVVDLYIPV